MYWAGLLVIFSKAFILGICLLGHRGDNRTRQDKALDGGGPQPREEGGYGGGVYVVWTHNIGGLADEGGEGGLFPGRADKGALNWN